ncbi:MAG: type II toxin-antitoxin system VapC family toxin [Myxococcales bacterium]|nr:type II toxin-antitoxin system VapC family toxin [Myxococcales bacterium]
MPRLFLDTNIVVRFVEGTAETRDRLQRRLAGVRAGTDAVVTSELVRFECLVGPRRSGARAVEMLYERFFSAGENDVRPLDRAVFDLAVGIRAEHRFSTPDALHLATAIVAGCDIFLTADRTLARFPRLPVEVLFSET